MALSSLRTPSRAVAALVVVAAVLLAGCGSDAPPGGEGGAAPAPASPTDGDARGAAPTEGTTTPSAPSSTEATTSAEAGSDDPAAAPPEEAVGELVITIVDFAYELPGTVPPGSTVTVVNEDSAAHTVTSGGAFDVSVTSGESATFTAPEEPGEYEIICLFHGNMTATLVVG